MKPVIGIICDTAMNGPHLFHSAGDKYIRAVRECMDATPLLIPSLDDNPLDIDELTNVFDGFLLNLSACILITRLTRLRISADVSPFLRLDNSL